MDKSSKQDSVSNHDANNVRFKEDEKMDVSVRFIPVFTFPLFALTLS